MTRYTRTQQAVLSAMALSTAVTLDESRNAFPDQPVTGVILGVESIARGARVSEYRAALALKSLVQRGDVIADRLEVGFAVLNHFQLNPELTARAIERWQPVIDRDKETP